MAAPALQRATAFHALDARWGRSLIPSLSDFFFLALIVWLFGVGAGWNGLLLDGDTGWHIRTGEYILQHGAVPHHDIFSWSKAGAPWFAWEWLTDVQFAFLHARWGLGGVAVFSGILICLSTHVLLRNMLSAGANVFVALLLALLYVGASSMHHHARPHVWTLLLFAIATGMLARDLREKTRALWLLVPLSVLWTNLHGGFLALVACAVLTGIGVALEQPARWRESLRYASLAAACAGASLLNPYGLQLHLHVLDYLQSDFIHNAVQEFQSPSFRSESAKQFEVILVLGLGCAGLLIARRRYVQTLWILYFAHQALASARHIPLYVLIAAPVVADELTRLWNRFFSDQPKNSLRGIFAALAADTRRGFHRTTVWMLIGLAPVLLLTTHRNWPKDFARTFPTQMIAAQSKRIVGSRLFTTDQWGDYILYRLWPAQKVFVDGRSDFYGAQLGKEYLSLMNAEYRWADVVKRYGFDLMLLPVNWPLASVLKLSPEWRVVADDGNAILFERTSLPRLLENSAPRG